MELVTNRRYANPRTNTNVFFVSDQQSANDGFLKKADKDKFFKAVGTVFGFAFEAKKRQRSRGT